MMILDRYMYFFHKSQVTMPSRFTLK